MTKAGNVIIAPVSIEASKTLLDAKLPENLTIKTVENKRKRFASPYLVLHGVPTVVDADAIKEATGFASRRLLSAANKGQPTSKVRITITSEEEKKDILQNGLLLGHQRIKAVEYKDGPATLQCYKCYAVGHIAKNCEKERQCRRCGGAHLAADCISATPKCSNCGQEHEATHPACPTLQAQKEKKQAKILSTAAKNRQPADTVEALRLAACVSACLQSFATKASLVIQQSDINAAVARSVRETYKVNLTGPHIKSLLLEIAGPSEAQL